MESDGFLRTSNDRADSAYILTLGPEFSGRSKTVEGKFDLRAMAFTSNISSITLESRNAYIATSKELMTEHQVTLGRRQIDWSKFDDTWKFGMWSPRFLWDPLRPDQIGLTGAFYQHESSTWRLTGYASPVAIPERSYPVQNVAGRLSSPSPFFIPLPERLIVMNAQSVAINYNVKTPNYNEVIFRPNAAFQAKFGREKGFWASAGYAYLPIHQIDLAIEASLSIPSNTMNADIYPRFPMHHMITAESGFNHRMWSLWTSVTGEQPTTVETKETWIANSTGPALISAAGGSLKWQEGLVVSGSYLFVLEQNRGLTGPSMAQNVNLTLPSRFPYRRAFEVGGNWDSGSPTMFGAKWTLDTENQSNLISADMLYRARWKKKFSRDEQWAFGLGADFISSVTSKGTIGQYNGDDRVRGTVTYVF